MEPGKKGKLTLALLGLAKGKGTGPDDDSGDEDMGGESESTDGGELPMGLEEAVREFFDAAKEDDSRAGAEAFHRALQCCDVC